MSAERIARAFFETAGRLAPQYACVPDHQSWEELPEPERELLVAVVEQLLAQGDIECGVLAAASDDPAPRAHFEIFPKGDGFGARLRGVNGEVVFEDDVEHETDYAAEKSCADLVRNAMWARGVVAASGFSINVERTEE